MNELPKPEASAPGGDPWASFGYLVAGVAFYGVIGWLVSIWLHAGYWIPIGILVGAGFGMYLTFARYRFTESGADHPGLEPPTADAADEDRPDSDDRGETA